MRLLLVEDHPSMRELTAAYLRERGFAVDEAGSAGDAIAATAGVDYDAVVLDLGLPDLDGMAVLSEIRRNRLGPPILIVTARDRIDDRLGGLNAGADDYLVKPFDLTELEARIRAVLRRPGPRSPPLRGFGDLLFDPSSRQAKAGGAEIDLTRREASVLEELIEAAGRLVVKDALEDRIYGFNEEASANAIEAAVSRLRRKLAASGSNVTIETSRGLGYRLALSTPLRGP